MATQTKVIGPISAYAIAVQEGYTGSKSEWGAEIGNAQENAQIAAEAADRAQSLTESLPQDFTDTVANFAPDYSPSGTYSVGDYVIHNGLLYRCTTAIASGESWTSGHWTQVNVGGEIKGVIEQAGSMREFNPTGAGSTKFDYAFKAGETYLFVNNSAVNCTLSTNDGTSRVETIGTLTPGQKVTFVPTLDAPKLNCYLSARDDTGSIYAYNGNYAKTESQINAINDEIGEITESLEVIDDIKSEIEQIGTVIVFHPTRAGSTKFDYEFTAGNTYFFENNSAVECTLTTNNGTSMVERIGNLLPGTKVSFVPTQDAPKLNCYLSSSDSTGSISAYNGDYAKINEDISEINDSLDGLEGEDDAIKNRIESIENMEPSSIYSTSVSGTQSVQVSVNIPAGQYIVKCTNVTSADTDSDKCGVYFSVGTTEKALLYVDRGPGEYSLTLPEAITHIVFWASNTYAKGAGDAFSFDGFSIEKNTPIVDAVTSLASQVDNVSSTVDEVAKLSMSGTYTGTTQYWTAKEFPEGDYYIKIGGITTDDTDAEVSTVMFTTSGNAEKLSMRFVRGKEQTRHFHLPSGVGRIFLFPSKNYASSLNDNFTFSDVSIWKVNEGLLNNREITTPAGFTWTAHPLVGHLFRTENGIECDFDVADLRPKTGKVYWVSPDGNDSAAGTDAEHPLQSLRTALQKNDVDTIIVKDGFYESSLSPGHVQGLNRTVAIIADEGANPVISSNTGAHTWTKTSGYTYLYETAVTDTNTVWDIANGIPYTRVVTIAEAEAAEATYYCDGTKTYVHTKSGDAPTTAIRCCAQRDNFRITTSGRITLYVEGLTICGGDDGAFQIIGDGSTRPLVYGKNCLFTGGFLYGACYLGGCESIMQDCEACESTSDGFGLHMNLATGTVPPLAVEINCEGYHNEIAGDLNNDNGTTLHAGGKAIRVNGRYHHNKGPNVADVHANTQSWNLGCRAWASTSRASNTYNFEVSTRGPEMWLDTCAGFGSTCSLYVGTGSTTHLHNCALVNMQVNEDAYIEAY